MVGKRVLIASQYPIFDEGLHAMLVGEPGIEIVGVCRGDTSELERQAQDAQADVILILGEAGETLENTAGLLEYAAPCLINIPTDTDAIHIYHRRVLHECELKDVVAAILSGC